MTMRRATWVACLAGLATVMPAGCEGDADGGDDAATCAPGAAACDGDDRVACVDGAPVRTPCGPDAYCSHGECVATSIRFPDDAGFHAERTEWWYYTGHLAAGERRWGFEVTIFQYDFETLFDIAGYGYMCHVAVTDKVAGEHYHNDIVDLKTTTWTNDPIVLEVADCRFEMDGHGRDHVVGVIHEGWEKDGKASPWVIDLVVEPRKRPVRHGTDGIIPMSAARGTSWYYSFTRLDATGTLTTPDGDFAVTGQAWMDHQWGDFDVVDFKGWDWWSMQFEDGWEVMLFQFTDWDGHLALKAGTIADPDGNLTPLDGMDAFTITPLRTWASPHTDGVYPLDWDVAIPGHGWTLAVRTAIDDQEMHNIAQNYWEGDTTVTGTRDGTPVTGVGYTELTGYATDLLDPEPAVRAWETKRRP